MRITWDIAGKGSGEAVTESVDGAAEALAQAVREAYADEHTTTVLVHLMLNVVTPLRLRLVNEGRDAVEHGREWRGGEDEVSVTLRPE